jgi:hemerythrin superfamily protein
MNLPEINHQNIAQLLNKEAIIQETITQIQKDFGMYSIEINFDGNIATAYEQLMNKLGTEITNLLAMDKNKLQSILYRIDLSERNIQLAKNSFHNMEINQVIAHEIIVRELKKVLTRNYFKNLG